MPGGPADALGRQAVLQVPGGERGGVEGRVRRVVDVRDEPARPVAAVTDQPDERVEQHHRAGDDDGGREVEAARHMRTLGRPTRPAGAP